MTPSWLDGDHFANCMGCPQCDDNIEEVEEDPDRLHDGFFDD